MQNLIDVAELGARLGQDLTEDDPLATIAVEAASDVVNRYVEEELGATEKVAKLDGSGTDVVMLPTAATSVSSVTVDDEELGEDDYELGEHGMLYRAGGNDWTFGRRNVVVEYVAGYDEVPRSAALVALQVAERIYKLGAVKQESMGSAWSGSYVDAQGGLTTYERDILNGLRSNG